MAQGRKTPRFLCPCIGLSTIGRIPKAHSHVGSKCEKEAAGLESKVTKRPPTHKSCSLKTNILQFYFILTIFHHCLHTLLFSSDFEIIPNSYYSKTFWKLLWVRLNFGHQSMMNKKPSISHRKCIM